MKPNTWKPVEKDGVECLQIKLAVILENSSTSNDQTAYAYEVGGEYLFDLTFPLVIGMSYNRTVTMAGGEQKQFNSPNELIEAYKADFVEPEHLATFYTEDNSGILYLEEENVAVFYINYDILETGSYEYADGLLTVVLGSAEYPIEVTDGSATFVYNYTYGDASLDFELVASDLSGLNK